jgi:hypothetical protein
MKEYIITDIKILGAIITIRPTFAFLIVGS